MTLRLDPQLEAELRAAAEEDHRSVHQTVILAVETYLACGRRPRSRPTLMHCELSPRPGRL